MFQNNDKIKEAFAKSREDISTLKESTDAWVKFLIQENEFLKHKLEQLELKVKELELEKDMRNYG